MTGASTRGLGVAVVALDRWGRALLVRDANGLLTLPAGTLDPMEPPDAGALRVFEVTSGVLLEQLRFARLWRQHEAPFLLPWAEVHLYFDDPDLDPAHVAPDARVAGPDDLNALPLDDWVRNLLDAFFTSPPYRALFH